MKIENQLDSKRKQQIIENRRRLKPIIECIILLGCQNISFRGHRDDGITLRDEKSTEHASPINRGNFKAILEYRAIGDEVLCEHLKNAGIRSTYISKTFQNEFISIIGDEILSTILKRINQSEIYSIIFDETTDTGNISQMSLIVRSVCNNIVYEDFLGFIDCHKENYNCENTEIGPILSGKVLASTVINVLNKHHLDLKKCVGIGTDGCSVMLGEQKGAVAELKKLLVNALKSPCYNHALNLSVSKTSKVQSVRNSMGTIKEVISFFSMSSKRMTVLRKYNKSNLIKLCETRWVERHESIFRFCSSLESIVTSLIEISTWQETDSSSKAERLYKSVLDSQFLFSIFSLSEILTYTVNLSKVLQATSIDRVTAMNMICQVLELLESKRKNVEKSFDAIYAQVNSLHEKLDINVSIPRICARQINRANIQTNNPKDYFRITVYIPILDFVIEDLKFRFDGDLMNILNLNVVLPSTFSKLNTDEIGMSIKKIAKFLVCLGYDDYDEVLTEMKLKSEIDFSVRLLQ
nr:unnamed protein product [Callosobruchus analis]